MKHIIQSIFNQMSELVWPPQCRICESRILNETNIQICNGCINYISPLSYEERYAFHQSYLSPLFEYSFIFAHFDNHVRPILHDLKYGNVKSHGLFMANKMYEAFEHELDSSTIECIIPCPMHKEKLKLREYNQAELIAQQLSHLTGIPIRNDVLLRNRNTKTQTQLTKSQREKNLHNVFEFINADNFTHVLFVDDVVTTGTTFLKMADAIKAINPTCKIDVAAFATPYFN